MLLGDKLYISQTSTMNTFSRWTPPLRGHLIMVLATDNSIVFYLS